MIRKTVFVCSTYVGNFSVCSWFISCLLVFSLVFPLVLRYAGHNTVWEETGDQKEVQAPGSFELVTLQRCSYTHLHF